jgi:hypothetical protein
VRSGLAFVLFEDRLPTGALVVRDRVEVAMSALHLDQIRIISGRRPGSPSPSSVGFQEADLPNVSDESGIANEPWRPACLILPVL